MTSPRLSKACSNDLLRPSGLIVEDLPNECTTGESETLDRAPGQQAAALTDSLLRIGKDCAAHLKEPFRSKDHGDLLYDDKGLPDDK
jgi:antitoxin VapB